MNPACSILADNGGDIGQLLQLVFMIALAIIAVVASIAKKAYDERQAARRQQEQRGHRGPPPQPAQRAQPARQAFRQAPILLPVAARPAPAARTRPPEAPRGPGSVQAVLEEAQVSRPAPQPPVVAETPPEPLEPPLAVVDLDLTEADQARRAILYHEILSAPKSLRVGKEMWDL